MNRTNRLLLGAFVMVALSCNALSRSLPISNPSTSEPESPFVPTLPSNPQANPTSASQPFSPPSIDTPNEIPTSQILENAQSPCGANQWRIIANSKFEQPSTAGLKWVIVQLLLENSSSNEGEAVFIERALENPPIATSEGGYTYPGKFVSGTRWSGGAIKLNLVTIVPGSIYSGGVSTGSPQKYEPILLSFEVAETQQKLSIVFPWIRIYCNDSNLQSLEDNIYSFTIDVDNDLSHPVDISAQFNNFKSIDEGIDVEGIGRFEFVEVAVEKDGATGYETLTLRFKFTNASVGYKTSGRISTYLLNESGVVFIHPNWIGPATGAYEAGPGQTSDVELKYLITESAEKLAFVVTLVSERDTNKFVQVYQAYNLP